MEIWHDGKIKDFVDVKGGKRLPKGNQLNDFPTSHPYIRIRDIGKSKVLQLTDDYKYIDDETQKEISRYTVSKGDILISVVGTIGLVGIVGDTLDGANQTENCDKLTNFRRINRDFLYYYLVSPLGKREITKGTVGAVQPKLPLKNIQNFTVRIPSFQTQRKIASMLSVLDKKIENNREINKNLEEQAQAIYKQMFIDTTDNQRSTCQASEYFDITIGKTPPRKQQQWFTTNPSDVTWLSISDMGNCGTYINKSSENLTQAAIDKFNVKIVPNNTVILSFKLTVGRIAITYGTMTTNEAIAHFKTDKPFINEYLYCYLNNFNYETMGSTSSIASAINSKIIRAMPFIVPTDDELSLFHSVAGSMFRQMLNNQLENDSLIEMRDTLLPKLMSGEIDVSNLDI